MERLNSSNERLVNLSSRIENQSDSLATSLWSPSVEGTALTPFLQTSIVKEQTDAGQKYPGES
jgi:hypothetical protein